MGGEFEGRAVGKDGPFHRGYFDLAEMGFSVRRGVDAQALHRRLRKVNNGQVNDCGWDCKA